MKSIALFAAICAVALSAGGTKTANADTLDFDFTITGMSGGQQTGDTVTGEIDGLSSSIIGSQPASAVILESYNVALLGAIPGCLPCDTTKSPWVIGTDTITHLPLNDFTVSNGQIVAANFFSNGPNLSSLELSSSIMVGVLAGPEEETTGGPMTFSPVSPATPLPATLPLFATGLGALGLLGWRRKRKARVFLHA